MRKQIAGALMASVLLGSAPGWADDAIARPPSVTEVRRAQLRASIERAVALTAAEREDLAARQAALRTDPVASGAGGIVMGLVATAVSIGLTVYLLKKTKETTTIPAMGRP